MRAHAPRAMVALDNTWGAGIAFDAFDLEPGAAPALGADLTIHALTKYPSGGADVMMGSVVTRSQALHDQLALTHSRLGPGRRPERRRAGAARPADDGAALRRAGRRRRAASRSGRWAAGSSCACCIRRRPARPATSTGPRSAARRPGLVTLEFDPAIAPERVDAFVDGLRLFGIGWSWAGPMSLAVPYRAGLGARRAGYRGHAGAAVDRAGGRRRPDPRPGGGLGDAGRRRHEERAGGARHQSLEGPETLCRISRPFSRSQSRSLIVLRLSWSALPLASAMSAFT